KYPTSHVPPQVPVARDKFRYVGEPLAIVIAQTRYLAEDAVAAVTMDFEPLPAVVDLERALAPGSARVHDDLSDNIAAQVRQTKGDYAAARASADHVVRRRLVYDH